MEILAKVQYGSKLYGTDIATSDNDYRAIYLPSLSDCVTGKIKDAWEDKSEEDTSYFSLQHFIRIATEGQSLALEMLSAPLSKTVASSNVWEFLTRSKEKFYTKNMHSFLGYSKTMASKYSARIERLTGTEDVLNALIKANGLFPTLDNTQRLSDAWDFLPTSLYAEKGVNERASGMDKRIYKVCGRDLQANVTIPYAISVVQMIYNSYGERVRNAKEGIIEWKSLSHAFRAAYQCLEIVETGDLKFPLKRADWLRDLRLGKIDFFKNELDKKLDDLIIEVQEKLDVSGLPDKCDPEFGHEVIRRAYDEYYGTTLGHPGAFPK